MKPTISKERFCKTVQAITDYIKYITYIEIDVAEALDLQTMVFSRSRKCLVDNIVELIEEAMGDDDGVIADFIYEPPEHGDKFDLDVDLRCGKKVTIRFKGWEDLYDFLAIRAAQEGDGEENLQERLRLCKAHGVLCC